MFDASFSTLFPGSSFPPIPGVALDLGLPFGLAFPHGEAKLDKAGQSVLDFGGSGFVQMAHTPAPGPAVDRHEEDHASKTGSPGECPEQSVKDYAAQVLAELRAKLSAESSSRKAPHREADRPALTAVNAAGGDEVCDRRTRHATWEARSIQDANASVSIADVLQRCPLSTECSGEATMTWLQMFEAAWRLGRAMVIGDGAMAEFVARLGREGFAVAVFALFQRQDEILRPTPYLRAALARPGFRVAGLLANCA